jgi:hypothetical protein
LTTFLDFVSLLPMSLRMSFGIGGPPSVPLACTIFPKTHVRSVSVS